MIPRNKILLYFTPWNKVTLFHGKILKPISDVKFVNIANLSITNFCGIWKFLILSSLKVYFKCLFRRSWGSEIKSNYKFNVRFIAIECYIATLNLIAYYMGEQNYKKINGDE